MRLAVTAAATCLSVAAIGGSYMWGLSATKHNCAAPCTVRFSAPMAEDSFGFDYHDKVVDVFWSAPDETED